MTTHAHTRGNGRDVNAKIHETKKALSDAAHKAKATATSMTEKIIHDVQEQGKEVREQVTTYVKKKPLAALGGAVLVGFVLSWLLRR